MKSISNYRRVKDKELASSGI